MEVTSHNPIFSRFSNDLAHRPERIEALRYSQLERSVERNAGITIVTAEGDRVTINSNYQSQSSYASYDYLARSEEGTSREQAQQILQSESRSYSISVEGELSEEELADIQKAIEQTEAAMRDAFSGDLDGALEKALEIGELDSIQSLEASVEITRTVSAERLIARRATGGESPESAPEGNEGLSLDALKQLIEEVRGLIKESGIAPEQLKTLVDSIRGEIPEEDEQRKPKQRLLGIVANELFGSPSSNATPVESLGVKA